VAAPISQLEGKYEILEKIKEGGMGAVYKVRHRLLDEIRVVKLIRPQLESDENIRARFLGEARKGVRLRHRHIAQFYDFSIDADGNAFIVMEFVEGITLEDMLRKVGPASIGLTLEVADQSLQALGYLHKRGIVHRDISPDNLMVGVDEDGNPLVRLIDLGIAKVLTGESGLTQAGTFLGKVRYASPEQFRGQEGVGIDFRSDVYSFGIVLYELLTGMHPIRGSNLSSFIAGHLFNPPLDFATSDPSQRISTELRAAVLKALEKQPERRYESAAAFAQELARIRARVTVPPEEIGSILTACHIPAVRPAGARLSTTQERLNREFGLSETPSRGGSLPTPPPAHGPGTVPMTPAPGESAAGAVEETRSDHGVVPQPDTEAAAFRQRLAAVEDALRAGDLDAAEAGVADASERFGAVEEIEDARKRVAARREAQRREEAAARRRRALGEEQQRIGGALRAGRLDEAARALDAAFARLGGAPELDALRAQLADARSRERRARIEALLGEANDHLARERFAQALACLNKATEIEPDNAAVAALEARVRDAQRAYEEERRRQASLAKEVRRLDGLLNKSDLKAAASGLEAAVAAFGPADELKVLRARLDEALARERRARVEALLAGSREHLAGRRFAEALAALAEAAALDPKNAAVAALDAKVREAQKADEDARRRQESLARERQRIDGLIAKGDLDGAAKALDSAGAALGRAPELDALRTRLAEARETKRRAAVEALLGEARERLSQRKLAPALATLAKAEELDHGNAEAARIGAAVREAQHADEEEKRLKEAIAKEVRRLDALVGKGDLDAAARGLETVVGALGTSPEFDAFRTRLAVAREKKLRAAVASLLAEARAHAKAGEFDAALSALESARKAAPDDARVRSALAETRDAQARASASEAHAREVAAAVAAVEETSHGGPLAVAIAKLDFEAARLGDDPAFRALRRSLVKRQQAEAEKPVAAPAPQPPPKPTPPARKPAADEVTVRFTPPGVPAREAPPAPSPAPLAPTPTVRRAPAPTPAARPRVPVWAWPAGGAAVVLLVVIAWLAAHRAPAPGPSAAAAPTAPAATVASAEVHGEPLLVDARPWGELVSIVNERGEAQPLPAERFTPVVLELPPGRYVATLRNPGVPKPVAVSVEVGAGRDNRCRAELGRATADEFLARYGW